MNSVVLINYNIFYYFKRRFNFDFYQYFEQREIRGESDFGRTINDLLCVVVVLLRN